MVEKFKPEMASLNTNSMNFAMGDWKNHVVLGGSSSPTPSPCSPSSPGR